MAGARLTDLDELVLTIRDRWSQFYISEAISAYRGGACRAAIISAWVAVAYDIIAKIRELAGQGDRQALAFTSGLDAAIGSKSASKLQAIEDKLLKEARDSYEFLSAREHDDLERLKADRNLCAHPAFASEDQLFDPTPELVRAHLVHAIVHLLRHPPCRGGAPCSGSCSASTPHDD